MLVVLTIAVLVLILPTIYYNRIIWRLIGMFTEKKEIKGKIAVWILSVLTAVMTFNLFSVAGIFLLHFLVFSLLTDLVMKFADKDNRVLKKIVGFCIIPFVISMIFFGYGYFNARNIVRTDYAITSDKLSDDYKILFISDIHYGTIIKSEELKNLKERLDGEKADIVILGGDIVDESTTKAEMQEVIETLGDISNKYGVYFVSGNHDFQKYSRNKGYSEAELKTALSESGIRFLKDETVEISDEIVLAGRDEKSIARTVMAKLLENADKEKYIITVDHQPVEYDMASKNGTDLIVSGHTHAGQVFPAGYLIKYLFDADLWYGYEKVGNMDAVVSSGAAGWGFPIRTQKNSEYVIINVEGMKK